MFVSSFNTDLLMIGILFLAGLGTAIYYLISFKQGKNERKNIKVKD